MESILINYTELLGIATVIVWGIALLLAAGFGLLLGFAVHWIVTYRPRMIRQRSEAILNRIVAATPDFRRARP